MGRGKDNERIVLDCKFGKLVCEVVRDDDEYREFAIDLYRNDGKAVQVCVVGTAEGDYEYQEWFDDDTNRSLAEYHDKVHVTTWDGNDPEPSEDIHYVEPFGDGWWGEETV